MSIGPFDDGSPDIPDGITGPVGRVLVVGAGIAGLTVANALHHAGVDCTVFEARPRLGGRLHTLDLAGSPVDLGGSWLHHPSGNRLRRFAEAAGIECGPGDPLPTISTYDVATARWLPDEDMATVLAGGSGRLRRGARRPACGAGSGCFGSRGDRCVPGLVRADRRGASACGPGASRERRGGCRRCCGGSVAPVAVDAGGVRRRLLRRPASARLRLGRGCHGVRPRRPA